MSELTSLVTLCELGDVGCLSASRKAVRIAGIDIGVHRSDRRSRVGKINRQGSPHLRWALYPPAFSNKAPSRIARPYGRHQTEPSTSIFMPRGAAPGRCSLASRLWIQSV